MTGNMTPGTGLTLPALDDRPGPARRISGAQAERLVGGALAASLAARPAPALARRAAIAAAVMLALGGAASAAFVVSRQHAAVVSPLRQAPRQLAVAAPSPLATTPTALPAAPPAPAVVGRQARARAARPPVLAVDRLSAANELRGQGHWREAERAYRQVAAAARGAPDDPNNYDGYAATVAAASLRLEHLDDPRGARALYAAVLRARPAGALAEEARWGLAESERRLGNRAAEAEALRGFVAHHPSALQRARAEARLDALTQ